MLIITLITILAFLKLKSPTRSSIDQITLNASTAAAAAAVAAHHSLHTQSPNLRDTSSFNPYRYFSPSAEPGFVRNASTANRSIFADSGSPAYQRQKPANASYNTSNLGETMITSPQRFNRFVPYERDQLRLFSVRDVGNASYTSFEHNVSNRYNPDDDHFNQSY